MNRPGPLVLLAFGVVVVIGSTNFVAVRLTNRELPPVYSAAVRFAAAAVLLLGMAAVVRAALPRGRALIGAVLYGVLQFGIAYPLVYVGLEDAPAALAGVIFGASPLFTLLLASVQGLERFRLRALIGALIAIGGVLWIARAAIDDDVPVMAIVLVALAMIGASQAAVTVKRFPPMHPLVINGVGMAIGAPLLFGFSLIRGEEWVVPREALTWGWLTFLIIAGSVVMFALFIYVVHNWTATAASYQFVFFPILTPVAAALIADEPLSGTLAVGGVLVVIGTYVGAFATRSATPEPASADRTA